MRPLLSIALGVALSAVPAFAQPSTPAPTTTSNADATATSSSTSATAFASLSPGNRKIAQALYEAQKTSTPSSPSTSTRSAGSSAISSPRTSAAPSKLTLDQIAGMKQSGRGWGQIFKDMKAQGLVQEKSLGQVVRSWHRAKNTSTTISSGHSSGYASTGPVISTASGRTYIEAPKGGELDGAEAPGDGAGASGGAQVGSAAASVSLGGSGNGAAHAASAAGPGRSPKN